MKYTKEQLQAMSDGEVNAALASIVHKKIFTQDEIKKLIDIGGIPCNYCSTPNDIMPLAFGYKISVFAYQDATLWAAQHYFDAIGINTVIHKNPLRAIACCLILVLQGEKE